MIEHAKYTEYGSIVAIIDGVEMTVPDNMANRHRQMIAEWEAQGNTIEPYTPPEPEPPTLEGYRAAIRAHVDATAQTRNYDNAVSCASYVNSTNPQWAAEAQAFVAWRDAAWAYVFAELAKVENGQRHQPAIEEFVGELTAAVPMEWPS